MATMTPRELVDEVLANDTPAGRIDAILEMRRDGRLTEDQAYELLGMPEMTVRVRTPVGDITVCADPTLKPDEFRIETPAQSRIGDDVVWQREYLGRWVPPGPADKKESQRKLTKTRKTDAPRQWVEPVWPSWSRPLPVAPSCPDGFAQSKIDEIKAMLTAPVKGKLK